MEPFATGELSISLALLTAGLHADIFFEPSGDKPASCHAVKIVTAPEDGVDASRRPHNVIREVRILRRATHPNVSDRSVGRLLFGYGELALADVRSSRCSSTATLSQSTG